MELGREAGREEGREEGMRRLLLDTLQAKFGKLPRRAQDRQKRASAAQVGTWAKKVLKAETIEGVLGPRDRW